jgi:hypothetical protein
MSVSDPAAACLERTRSAVLNVLVIMGAGIAASGLILGRRDRGALLVSERVAERGVHLALFLLIVASFVVRRVVGARSALRDPERRAARFYRAHVVGAVVGALAIPLGFGYGWAVRPRIDAVAPFWVAALALGLLAWPRAMELEGFDEAMPHPGEPPT